MTIYQILWTFFIYSFVGWCSEVAFAACKTGKFVNRGFLCGPVCPIYGFGVAAVVLLIKPIQDHWFQAYLVAALVPTVIEYFVGWLADKILHTRLWDYSNMPLNLNGYVCLLFSLVWGLACMLVVYFIHPTVLRLVGLIPVVIGWVLLAVFGATIVTDLILTGMGALKIPKRIQAVDELERRLRAISDGIGSNLSEKTLELWDKSLERRPAQQAKWEEFLNSMGERKQEFLTQRDELLERYRPQLEKPNKVYTRLSKAFPHLQKSEDHRRLERIGRVYRRSRENAESRKKCNEKENNPS